jgi:protein TonB
MGAKALPEYESMENGILQGSEPGSETRAGGVEHNELMGLEAGSLPSGLNAGRPGTTGPATNMAKNLLTKPDSDTEAVTDGHELDFFLGKPFEEPPIWKTLYENVHDVFFPPKLPPLELTSTPIPVLDRMAVKPNPWAIGIATGVNLLILAAVLYFGARVLIDKFTKPVLTATDIDVGEFKAPKSDTKAGGGGGGGDHSLVDASKGKLPKFEKNPITPPQVQTIDHPLLPMEAAINVQKDIVLPDNPMLPNIGVKNSANVRLASNGQGGGGGMGTGYGGGMGSGSGNGYGPGSGGNAGGGVYRVGGQISAPVLTHGVDPEFSDEARRSKYQGICLISVIVDAQGNPQNPRVVRPLGMGLDEKALEAVRQFKFKPALKDGKTPVPVMMTVEINFRLY